MGAHTQMNHQRYEQISVVDIIGDVVYERVCQQLMEAGEKAEWWICVRISRVIRERVYIVISSSPVQDHVCWIRLKSIQQPHKPIDVGRVMNGKLWQNPEVFELYGSADVVIAEPRELDLTSVV